MSFLAMLRPPVRVPVKLVIYLDAGKGNSRGAIVQVRNGVPHILYTILGEQKVGQVSDLKGGRLTAIASLEEILQKIAKLLQKSSSDANSYVAEEIYCILASPFYLTHTAIINFEEGKPSLFTNTLLKSIVSNAKSGVTHSHGETNLEDNSVSLHEKIIEIKINGYHTDNPFGKLADKISVSLFKTEINSDFLEEIKRTVKKHTPARISVEALSLATFVSLRNRLDAEDNFIFVTVGNEVTEVSLVKSHNLLETVSFPHGKHEIARSIGNKLNLPIEIAFSRAALYHDKKMHEEEAQKLKPVIEEVQKEWLIHLEKALLDLAEEISLPPQIYLILDTDLKDIFEDATRKNSFSNSALTPHGFSINALDTAKFADCCTFGLDIRFDTLLAISASFAGAAEVSLKEIYPPNR